MWMLNTCENLALGAQNVFSMVQHSQCDSEHHSTLFFFLDHKSPIAHRYNDLNEETFKGV